jgi:hypothetical protein
LRGEQTDSIQLNEEPQKINEPQRKSRSGGTHCEGVMITSLKESEILDSTRPEEVFRKMKGKNWCFTLAHPAIEEMNKIKLKVEEENDKLIKAIVGIERGSNDDFEHLQGDLSFSINYSGRQMKKIWNERAHWEKAKGNPKKNFEYCSKENNILAQKGFEALTERRHTEEGNQQYWSTIITDAMKLAPSKFAEKHPKEWLLRRSAIERLMLESSKKHMKAWDGKLSRKNIWICELW